MGYYINPESMTKEQFLELYGQKISDDEAAVLRARDSKQTTVCLVDNGPFTAAGICYDDRERDAFVAGFLRGTDHRPHQFYRVPSYLLDHLIPESLGGTMRR